MAEPTTPTIQDLLARVEAAERRAEAAEREAAAARLSAGDTLDAFAQRLTPQSELNRQYADVRERNLRHNWLSDDRFRRSPGDGSAAAEVTRGIIRDEIVRLLAEEVPTPPAKKSRAS